MLRNLLHRFRRNESGVAAVEFALILPILLLLYMGSIEASSLYTVDRRIDVISNTTADLVARWNSGTTAIPSNTLRDYFRASAGIITPYSTNGLKQVVSLLQVSNAGEARVVWSCAYNGGAALAVNSIYTLGEDTQNLSRGGYLVAATAQYAYKPVLGVVFTTALNLENEALFTPRFGSAVTAPSGGCPA